MILHVGKNAFQSHRDERLFPLFWLFVCVLHISLSSPLLYSWEESIDKGVKSFGSLQIERKTYITTADMNGFEAFHHHQTRPLQLGFIFLSFCSCSPSSTPLLRLLCWLVLFRRVALLPPQPQFSQDVLWVWTLQKSKNRADELCKAVAIGKLTTMGTVESNTAIGVLLGLLGLVIVLVLIRFCRCLKKIGHSIMKTSYKARARGAQSRLLTCISLAMDSRSDRISPRFRVPSTFRSVVAASSLAH